MKWKNIWWAAFIPALLTGEAHTFSSADFERMDLVKYRTVLRDAFNAYTNKRYEDAFHSFQRAACAGDKSAQSAVGRMYLLGQGVQRNDLTGYAWLAVAAEFVFPKYQSIVAQLKAAMNPEQLKLASAREDELKRLYGFAATNMSCEMTSSVTSGSNIKDAIQCMPRAEGSQVLVRRCVDGAPQG